MAVGFYRFVDGSGSTKLHHTVTITIYTHIHFIYSIPAIWMDPFV